MHNLRILRPTDSQALSDLHATSFPFPWSADTFEAELGKATLLGLGLEQVTAPHKLQAFILVQRIGGDAEVLTLVTEPEIRRHGCAHRLLKTAGKHLTARGVSRLYLEVAADNPAAFELYKKLGFKTDGKRKAYYKRLASPPVDAILMSCALKILI